MAWSSALPLGDSLYGDFALTYEVVGDPQVPEAQRPTTNYQVVSAAYFSTVDLPIVAGRAFDSRDTRDSPRVCIVNEAFVRTLGGRSPIGMKVSFRVAGSPQDKPDVGEIVGVAKQVKGRPDEPKDFVQIYVPMAHDLIDDTLLMVRPRPATPRRSSRRCGRRSRGSTRTSWSACAMSSRSRTSRGPPPAGTVFGRSW